MVRIDPHLIGMVQQIMVDRMRIVRLGLLLKRCGSEILSESSLAASLRDTAHLYFAYGSCRRPSACGFAPKRLAFGAEGTKIVN